MATSPFLTHLRRLFKFLVGYDVKTRKFNLWTGCYSMTNIIAIGTSAYRFSLHKVPKTDVMEQMTMTSILALIVLNCPVIIRSKNKLGTLIENLLEPVQTSEETTLKTQELRNYAKWANVLGIFFMINLYVINCVTVTLKPILTQKFFSTNSEVQDLPLPFGWIPFHTESYAVYYTAFFMGLISAFGAGACCTWLMTMLISALKIKLTLKLLANDVRNIDDIVVSRSVQRLMQLSKTSMRLVTPRQKMKISMGCRKHLLKELVERHLRVIRSVKLLNDCFSLSALVIVQTTSFIAALTLPRAILITKLPIWDLYFVVSCGCGALLLPFFPCYIGQQIENESDNLRRALYDYCWYNQPQRFKTSLRIMMTVATRPLNLTAGGIYPLNLETFSNIVRAFYSYVNFLLVLKEKGKLG